MTKVHIVEDDVDLCETYTDILESAGYQVAVDHHGRKAIRTLSRFRPDVVILDQQLPDMSGAMVLYFIRTSAELRNTRVIIVSGHEFSTQARDVDLFLQKPVSVTQLRDVIAEMMNPEVC